MGRHGRLAAAVIAAAALVACGSASGGSAGAQPSPPSEAEQIASWWEASGQANAQDLSTAQKAVEVATSTAGTVGSPADVATACDLLASTARRAENSPPPVETVATPWNEALDDYARGGNDCAQGARVSDAALLRKAVTEIGAGNTAAAKATTEIKRLTPVG